MKVEALMTRTVVTVRPETPLKEVAALLVAHRIAGVPVCRADGSLVGVLSEGDILSRETGQPSKPRKLLARLGGFAHGRGGELGAARAEDAMTAPAIAIAPYESAATAARRMIKHRVNRLPVVLDNTVVGIVARSDLVGAFARPDAEIALELVDELVTKELWIDPSTLEVAVENGSVTVGGRVETAATAEVLERRIREIPGVVGVEMRVDWTVPSRPRHTLADLHPRL
jgi:CBS domain-containing protein